MEKQARKRVGSTVRLEETLLQTASSHGEKASEGFRVRLSSRVLSWERVLLYGLKGLELRFQDLDC